MKCLISLAMLVLGLAVSTEAASLDPALINGKYKLTGGRTKQPFYEWEPIDPKTGNMDCPIAISVDYNPSKKQIVTFGRPFTGGVEYEKYTLTVESGPGPFDSRSTTLKSRGFKFKAAFFDFEHVYYQFSVEWKQDKKDAEKALVEARNSFLHIDSDCYYKRYDKIPEKP
jgi:hypothetical protein